MGDAVESSKVGRPSCVGCGFGGSRPWLARLWRVSNIGTEKAPNPNCPRSPPEVCARKARGPAEKKTALLKEPQALRLLRPLYTQIYGCGRRPVRLPCVGALRAEGRRAADDRFVFVHKACAHRRTTKIKGGRRRVVFFSTAKRGPQPPRVVDNRSEGLVPSGPAFSCQSGRSAKPARPVILSTKQAPRQRSCQGGPSDLCAVQFPSRG